MARAAGIFYRRFSLLHAGRGSKPRDAGNPRRDRSHCVHRCRKTVSPVGLTKKCHFHHEEREKGREKIAAVYYVLLDDRRVKKIKRTPAIFTYKKRFSPIKKEVV